MSLFIVLISVITLILLSVLFLGKRNERYWTKRGVKFYSKNKVAGVFWDFFTGKGPMFECMGDLYEKYRNEPAVGVGFLGTPSIFVIDIKNIQHVLLNDFNSFNHRGAEAAKNDPMADNILLMNGSRWKLVRESMSPLFTPAKLKSMYYVMDKSAKDFVVYLKDNPKLWKSDSFDTLTTFCNAAFCATIYGISSESIFESPFLKVIESITLVSFRNVLYLMLMAVSPRLLDLFGMKFFPKYEHVLVESMTKVIQQREKENVKKHDFADVAVNVMKNGVMKDPKTGYEVKPTYELLTAQAAFFLVAGVEPSAAVSNAMLIELGRNPEILQKIHEEIDLTFEENGNELSYDILNKMTYVNKVLSETLRRHTPNGFIIRQCVKDTILPVGNIKIDKGTKVFMPLYTLHNDPAIHPEPHIFDPERFNNGHSNDNFIPFGYGQRVCIASKFVKLQLVASMAHLLRHFTVKSTEVGGKKHKYHLLNVRTSNVEVEFIPRK